MSDAADEDALVLPTAVVGRRVAGWAIDMILTWAAVLAVLVALGDSFERPGDDTGLDVGRFGSDTAVFFRSTVAVVHAWEWAVALGVGTLVALLVFVLLPGTRGWSPGMLAADLRLVDGEGTAPGLRSSSVRTIGWILDALPGIPVVGFVAMRFSRNHQRIGDRLARSFVVDKRFGGRSPLEPAERDEGRPVPQVVEHDAPDAEGAGDPLPTDPGPTAGGPTDTEPATGGIGPAESPDQPTEAPAAPDGVVADQPVWNRDERRYEMWHGGSGRWVVYDDAEGTWVPRDPA